MNSKENEFNEWGDLSSDIEEHFKECVEPLFKPNEIPSLNYVLDSFFFLPGFSFKQLFPFLIFQFKDLIIESFRPLSNEAYLSPYP